MSKPFKVTFVWDVGPPLILTVDILPGPPSVLICTPGNNSKKFLWEILVFLDCFDILVSSYADKLPELFTSIFLNTTGSISRIANLNVSTKISLVVLYPYL